MHNVRKNDVKLFLSAVTDEFEPRDKTKGVAYRSRLRQICERPNVTVKVQDDFMAAGVPTLDKLDDYIQSCDAVVHLVGDMTGAIANPAAVASLLKLYPNLAERLPVPDALPPGFSGMSYTQWEAYLAILHGKTIIIAMASESAPRGQMVAMDDPQRQAQQDHLARLRKLGHYVEITFDDVNDLAAQVANSALLDLLARAHALTQNLISERSDSHRILPPGPKLKPLSIPVGGEPGTLHSDRRVKFVCRDAEIRELETFLNGPQQVAWQLWLGAAGMGKTRLAFEFCCRVDRSSENDPNHWVAGFLDFRGVTTSDWSKWTPARPMLIVVDYVEEHAFEVSTFIEQMAQAAQIQTFPKMRFLLLNREREEDSKWYEVFRGSDDHASWIDSTGFVTADGENRQEQTLKPFEATNLRDVVTAILESRGSRGEAHDQITQTADLIVSKFSRATFELRPLFVALAAEAALEGRDLTSMSHESLAEETIRHELAMWRKYFPQGKQGDIELARHITLVALATSADGFDASDGYRKLHELLAAAGMVDLIPPADTFANNYDTLAKFYSLGKDGDGERIPALRPDYLGELFVLEHLHSSLKNPSAQRAFVSAVLTVHPEGVLAFWNRASQNHARHPSIRLFLERGLEVAKKRGQSWPCRFGFGSVEQNMGLLAGRLGLEELESSFYDAAVSSANVSGTVMFTVAEYRWKKHGDRLGAIELLAKGTSKEEVPPQLLVNAAVLLARELDDKSAAMPLLYRLKSMEPVGPKANIYFAQAIADAAALLARELNDKRTAKQLLARLKTMSTVPMQAISTAASLLVRELDDKVAAGQLLARVKNMEVNNSQVIVDLARLLIREFGDKHSAVQLLMRLKTLKGVSAHCLVAGATLLAHEVGDRESSEYLLARLKSMDGVNASAPAILHAAKLLAKNIDNRETAKQLLARLESTPGTTWRHWDRAADIIKKILQDQTLAASYRARANSEREFSKNERKVMNSMRMTGLEPGQVVKGIVKNLADFGAFIDLANVTGLLHISDMAWSRPKHPSELVKVGEEIELVVLTIDRAEARVNLGMKQRTPDPWAQVPSKYSKGTHVRGQVIKFMAYGAFVKLEEGIEGLVHNSEFSWTQRVSNPNEFVSLGDNVEAIVLGIDETKREIALSIKQTLPNPWVDVAARFPVGTKVTGVVRNLANYGAFIEIEPGIEALLHTNDMSWTRKLSHANEFLHEGQRIECQVISLDPERKRVGLSLKQLTGDPWVTDIPTRYQPGTIVKGKVKKITNFGIFVELERDLEGLLHNSEISEDSGDHPEHEIKVGDEIDVRVLRVEATDHKIGLSRRLEPRQEEQSSVAESDEPEPETDLSPGA